MWNKFILLFFISILVLSLGCGAGQAKDCDLKIITELSTPSAVMEGDRLTGFGVETVLAIQKELRCTSEIEVMPWARGYKYLRSYPDVMLFSTARTAEREALFQWVGPIACYKWVFYGLKGGRKVYSLDEAREVAGIGVYRDDARAQFLQAKGFTNLEVTDSAEMNFKKLLRGRIELIATSDIGVKGLMETDSELRRRVVPVLVFRNVEFYLAFSKATSPEKIRRWQKALDVLKRRGVVGRIQDKWIQRCGK